MAAATSSQAAPAPTTNAQPLQNDTEKFDNLFKSSMYPDPFGENDDEIVEIQTNYDDTQTKGKQKFEASALQHLQQNVTAKVNQHRRYMSDTSGFRR